MSQAVATDDVVRVARQVLRWGGDGEPVVVARTVAVHGLSGRRRGMSCGGRGQVLVQPASDVPAGAWEALSALWPTSTLVVVGQGLIAEALVALAAGLGWSVTVATSADSALAAVDGLVRRDVVVVLSHDLEPSGAVLLAALAGDPVYVGALGSRRTQEARAAWSGEHGVPDVVVGRVRGPAGLDLAARTPAEIAPVDRGGGHGRARRHHRRAPGPGYTSSLGSCSREGHRRPVRRRTGDEPRPAAGGGLMSPSPPSPTRSAPAAEPTQQARVVVPAPLTATFAGGAIGLATADGQLAVQVPLDLGPWSLEEPAAGSGEAATATTTATSMATSTATSTGALAAVSVACLLDTALARRLYRRVSAWRRDSDGHLTARVRPSA